MSTRMLFALVAFIALVAGAWLLRGSRTIELPPAVETRATESESETVTANPAPVEVIADGLNTPWDLIFLPDGEMLVIERTGRVSFYKAGVELMVPNVAPRGEGGLLGAVLHPDFANNNYLYLYHTLEAGGGSAGALTLKNRVARYRLSGTELVFDTVIIENLPGANYHDGGRIAFGPDGYLYITVGDAGDEPAAQDPSDLAGSILRLTEEGEPAPGNPFGTAVYSYGHRNPQGLAWDAAGQLWSTEHGRSGLRSGFDELNRIEAGGNYGWPDSEGDRVKEGTIGPVRHSTASVTWAPGGLLYYDGSFFIPGLRGQTLYEAVMDGERVAAWREHFAGEYGRLRTIKLGPDGFFYLTTSNGENDKVFKIDPAQLSQH